MTSLSFFSFLLALMCFHGIAVLPTFIPRLGPYLFYRIHTLRIILAPLAFTGATYALFSSPQTSTWFFGILTILLLIVTFITTPPTGFFIVPTHPRHAPRLPLAQNSTLVLGAVIHEEACAWPIEKMLMPRHIVNDTLGNTPILVSFCAACRSALLYDATVDGRRLTFEVAGVWRRNMIIRDKETHSLWQQATGEALMGPLRGKRLTLLPATQIRWGVWKQQYPKTQIAVDEQNGWFPPKNALTALLKFVTSRFATPGIQGMPDKRLPAHEEVAGITVNGESRAYPIHILQKHKTIHDRMNDSTVFIGYDASTDQVRAELIQPDGQKTPLFVDRQWWLGWSEFHPLTSVYSENPV